MQIAGRQAEEGLSATLQRKAPRLRLGVSPTLCYVLATKSKGTVGFFPTKEWSRHGQPGRILIVPKNYGFWRCTLIGAHTVTTAKPAALVTSTQMSS
jgi:hypothetical protein